MKRFFVCILLLTSALLAAAQASVEDDLRSAFEAGNASYEAGEYEAAVAAYTGLVELGAEDKDLFYNLANAHYKLGDLGRAVLFYERARRLAPRDPDVRENLSLVRSQLRDEQFVREQNRLARGIAWLHNNLSSTEMTLFASCCYVVLCLLGILFVFRDTEAVSALYRRLSVVSPGRLVGLRRSQDIILAIVVVGLLFVSSGISAWMKADGEVRRDEAVVVEREAPVFSSPTKDTTLQFKIHEGTVVTTREQRREWTRISLPGGLSGWISTSSLERI
jgi:hypothetical protein